MDAYKYVFETLQGRLEFVDCKSVNFLKSYSEEYIEIANQIDEIYRLPWFGDFLNGKIDISMTINQIKTIHRFMNLQSIIDYDLKVMYYLCGMQDATMLSELYKQLNDYIAT